jgi:hypothetical protein
MAAYGCARRSRERTVTGGHRRSPTVSGEPLLTREFLVIPRRRPCLRPTARLRVRVSPPELLRLLSVPRSAPSMCGHAGGVELGLGASGLEYPGGRSKCRQLDLDIDRIRRT